MLEKIREFVKKNPIATTATTLSAGLIIGLAGNMLNGKDGKTLDSNQEVSIENVATKTVQATAGSAQDLNVLEEIKSYRSDDIRRGESKAAIFCAVNGSLEGKIDFTNQIQEFTSDASILENIKINIPTPSTGYDGKHGYGYFIVCGEKISDSQVKTNFYKRIVYHVVDSAQQINDNKTTFSVKIK